MSVLDSRDLQYGRDGLLESLQIYKQNNRHRITVVFDAADAPRMMQRKTVRNGVEIRFSPKGESADAVIMNMVRREREKAIVVSSDREIASFSSSQGAAILTSSAFERKLSEVQIAGIDDKYDEIDDGWQPTTRKKGPKKKLSRKMRKNRLKIRKL